MLAQVLPELPHKVDFVVAAFNQDMMGKAHRVCKCCGPMLSENVTAAAVRQTLRLQHSGLLKFKVARQEAKTSWNLTTAVVEGW